MSRPSKCPWTHQLLVALSALFMLAAVGQVFAGAAHVFWAAKVAGEVLGRGQATKPAPPDELSLKRAVQAAFRQGGLYVPMEDVILKNQNTVSVRLAVPIRVPWLGTFVYGMSRDFLVQATTGRNE